MKVTRRRLFGLLAGAAVAVGLPSVWISRMKTYAGPPSDHFDGTYFFDPDGSPPKKLWEVLRWQMTKQAAKWPEWAPSPYSDTPPPQVTGNKVRFCYVGHASWLIQTARPQHSGRSGLVGARLAGELCGSQARQRSGYCFRQAADH
jgi:hypothetical protein